MRLLITIRDTLLDLWHGWFIHQIQKNRRKFSVMAETKSFTLAYQEKGFKNWTYLWLFDIYFHHLMNSTSLFIHSKSFGFQFPLKVLQRWNWSAEGLDALNFNTKDLHGKRIKGLSSAFWRTSICLLEFFEYIWKLLSMNTVKINMNALTYTSTPFSRFRPGKICLM